MRNTDTLNEEIVNYEPFYELANSGHVPTYSNGHRDARWAAGAARARSRTLTLGRRLINSPAHTLSGYLKRRLKRMEGEPQPRGKFASKRDEALYRFTLDGWG